MAIVPFTPEGVVTKMDELYKLSETELLKEAQSVGNDVRTWFEKHFILDPELVNYLEEASTSFLLFLGYVFGTAIIGRRPVKMIRLPSCPAHPHPEQVQSPISGMYSPTNNNFPYELVFQGEVTLVFMED